MPRLLLPVTYILTKALYPDFPSAMGPKYKKQQQEKQNNNNNNF